MESLRDACEFAAECDEREDEAILAAEELVVCPVCDGDGQFLGALGNAMWLRCRDCGAEFRKGA